MAIFNANKDQLKDPDQIKPGQVLKIPQHTHS
jgi:nucleoid-associated protein YgaU